MYMLHMLLLPFLPIVALIVQNSMNLHDMLEYRRESAAIGLKVDGTTALGIRKMKLTTYVCWIWQLSCQLATNKLPPHQKTKFKTLA